MRPRPLGGEAMKAGFTTVLRGMALVLSLAGAGCGADDPEERSDASAVTAVEVNAGADGKGDIVRAQCDDFTLRVYDQPDYRGNQLCVKGAGALDLSRVTRVCVNAPGITPSGRICTGNWAGRIRSYRTNAYLGLFECPAVEFPHNNFLPRQEVPNARANVACATRIVMPDITPPRPR